MNNKWVWLIVGIVIGVYVVPAIRARSTVGG